MQSGKWLAYAVGTVIMAGASAASAQQIVVHVHPPHAIVERRIPAPGPGYVWIPGYQSWTGSGYVWVPGRWERPPRPHMQWVPYRWQRHGHTWILREGHWR